MAPPDLVIEIVSPGDLQRDRNYIAKRTQYQDRGIPEYWIVDPQRQSILLLALQQDVYAEIATLSGSDRLYSHHLGALNLTIAQVFATEPTEA